MVLTTALFLAAFAPDFEKVDFGRSPAQRVKLLRHEHPSVRRKAATLLAHAPADAAIAGLLVALSDRDAGVRHAAATALGTIGDERAVPFLARQLERERRPRVQAAVLLALARSGGEYVGRRITKFLNSPDRGVRAAAAAALGFVGDAGQRPALWAALRFAPDDPGFFVRSAVLDAFVRLGWKADATKAIGELEAMGALRHWASRVAVIAAVGAVGLSERTDWLRGQLKESDDPRVVAAAAGALALLGERDAVFSLLKHESAGVRRACLVALQESGDKRAQASAHALVERDPDADVRFEAALVLHHAGDAAADAYLVDALRSRNALYWITALGALEKKHKRWLGRDPDAWDRFLKEKKR